MTPAALLRDFPSNAGPWLVNSLKHRAAESRANEKRCRRAYTTEPMRTACEMLADLHAEAAAVFERALAEVKP